MEFVNSGLMQLDSKLAGITLNYNFSIKITDDKLGPLPLVMDAEQTQQLTAYPAAAEPVKRPKAQLTNPTALRPPDLPGLPLPPQAQLRHHPTRYDPAQRRIRK